MTEDELRDILTEHLSEAYSKGWTDAIKRVEIFRKQLSPYEGSVEGASAGLKTLDTIIKAMKKEGGLDE